MAVVNEIGPVYMTTVLTSPQTDLANRKVHGGDVHRSVETFNIDIGDSVTSTYTVGRLPRDAVLVPGSIIKIGAAVTGTLDLGDANDPNGLVAANDGAAGSVVEFAPGMGAVHGFDMVGKPLWQLLGFAMREAAPNLVVLKLTLGGVDQAVAAGTGMVEFRYTL